MRVRWRERGPRNLRVYVSVRFNQRSRTSMVYIIICMIWYIFNIYYVIYVVCVYIYITSNWLMWLWGLAESKIQRAGSLEGKVTGRLEPIAQAEAVVHRRERKLSKRIEPHGHGPKLLSNGGISSRPWRSISLPFKAFHLIQSGPFILSRIIYCV